MPIKGVTRSLLRIWLILGVRRKATRGIGGQHVLRVSIDLRTATESTGEDAAPIDDIALTVSPNETGLPSGARAPRVILEYSTDRSLTYSLAEIQLAE